MKKNSIKQRAQKVPPNIKLLVRKSMNTAKRISRILEEQEKTQKDLADLLGKKESEISKWLQGTHNFTYKTICNIEIALGEEILFIDDQRIHNVSSFVSFSSDTSFQHIHIKDTYNASKPTGINRLIQNVTSDNSTIKNGVNQLSLLEDCRLN